MIATMADVKILAELYTKLGNGTPTTATTGELGDIYVDIDSESATYGNSYLLTDITGGVYTWEQDTTDDARIGLFLRRAEQDYLRIRGREFDVDDDDDTVYPDGADLVGAEMVCYLLGAYEGRGKTAERYKSYEKKYMGYPYSIVGQIERFVGVV